MTTASLPLTEYAKVIRSKNSGPFEITFDIMFTDRDAYEKVKHSGAITFDSIAAAFAIPRARVLVCTPFDAGMALKITIKRTHGSGDIEDRDVYGCQQHLPLTRIAIPT